MDTQSFLTEEDARSFAARALSGDKPDGPKLKQAAPVQFNPVRIANALNRKKQILAKNRVKADHVSVEISRSAASSSSREE